MPFEDAPKKERKKRGPNKPKVTAPKAVAFTPWTKDEIKGWQRLSFALTAFDCIDTEYDQCSYAHIGQYVRLRMEHNVPVWVIKSLLEFEYGMPVEML